MQAAGVFNYLYQCIVVGLIYYYTYCVLMQVKVTWQGAVWALGLNAAVSALAFVLSRDDPYKLLVCLLVPFLISMFALKQHGWRVLAYGLIINAILLLTDMMGGFICIWTLGAETFNEYRYVYSPYYFIPGSIPPLCGLIITEIYAVILRWFKRRPKRELPMWVYIARPAALLAATIMLTVLSAARIQHLDIHAMIAEVYLNYAVCGILCVVSATYIVQDLRFIALKSQNQTLLQQQKINNALLSEMRTFRHNIGNMLYGFEGAAITGNVEEIRDYYQQMSRRCAMINNENIYSLQKIPDPAVSTLLLGKLDRARDLHIPFTINLADGLIWKGIRSSDLCEALGVLADNAIEAAQESEAPHVSVYISNVGGGMELMVSNTFPGERVDLRPGRSGKKAHEGLGLQSVNKIVKRYRSLTFNQYQAGRFVQSMLLIGG